MFGKLSKLLESLQYGFLGRTLKGAGIGLGSYTLYKFYFDQAVNAFLQQASGINASILALCHISGIDLSFQILLTAVLISLTANSSKLFLKKSA